MQIPTVMRAAPFYHPFGLICFVVGLIAYGLLMEFKYLYLKLSGRITCSDSPDGVVLQWGKSKNLPIDMLGESFIWSDVLWYLNPPQNIYLKVNLLLDVPGNDFSTPKSHIHVVQLGHLWCTVILFADFIKYFTSCDAWDERQNFDGCR